MTSTRLASRSASFAHLALMALLIATGMACGSQPSLGSGPSKKAADASHDAPPDQLTEAAPIDVAGHVYVLEKPRTDLDAGLCVQLSDGGWGASPCSACLSDGGRREDYQACSIMGLECDYYPPLCYEPAYCLCLDGRWACRNQNCP